MHTVAKYFTAKIIVLLIIFTYSYSHERLI